MDGARVGKGNNADILDTGHKAQTMTKCTSTTCLEYEQMWVWWCPTTKEVASVSGKLAVCAKRMKGCKVWSTVLFARSIVWGARAGACGKSWQV
jgi:hypothetical protein